MGFVMDGLGAEAYDRSYSATANCCAASVNYFRPHLQN